MDFSLDEDQRAVADLAADVLRKAGDDPDEVWAALAKVGLLALAMPEELGGDGLGVGVVTVTLREIGARGVPTQALASLALGMLPVAAHGTAAQQARLLPGLADGSALLTGAPSEPGRALTLLPRTTARRVNDRWVLDGVKAAVPYADRAASVLVPASLDDGIGVFLVDPAAEGVTVVATPTATGGPEHTVRLDGVSVPDDAILGGDTTGVTVRALREYALVGTVALGDGALAGALDLTTTHLRTRHQFGKPLATFQAVALQVADVYIAARTVHLAALAAAWRLGDGRDATKSLELAADWLAGQALPAARTCHHLHGGLGVDVTYPLHRYYSTLKDLTRFVGGQEH